MPKIKITILESEDIPDYLKRKHLGVLPLNKQFPNRPRLPGEIRVGDALTRENSPIQLPITVLKIYTGIDKLLKTEIEINHPLLSEEDLWKFINQKN